MIENTKNTAIVSHLKANFKNYRVAGGDLFERQETTMAPAIHIHIFQRSRPTGLGC
jgi:hypothetical protein